MYSIFSDKVVFTVILCCLEQLWPNCWHCFVVLEVGDGVFEVLSTSGDTHLGGDDFDKVWVFFPFFLEFCKYDFILKLNAMWNLHYHSFTHMSILVLLLIILGSSSFQRVVDWLAADFKRNEGIDLLKDKQALQRLTETAEKAKMELSSLTQTNIRSIFSMNLHLYLEFDYEVCSIFFWYFPVCLSLQPQQRVLNTLKPLSHGLNLRNYAQIYLIGKRILMQLYTFQPSSNKLPCVFCVISPEQVINFHCRLKTPVQNALRDAKLSFSDLDEVILVGGSTRIPAVQELVKKLTGKDPNVTVNPDEVVALGAAVQVRLCCSF